MSLCGWGSEIFPKEEPLWRRTALHFPRAPRRQTLATESSTPRRRPGKKPTTIAVIGNLLQDVAEGGDSFVTGVTEVEAPVAELDAVDVVDDAEDIVGAMFWSAFSTQSWAVLQE
jgi:hypothetical protein